MIAAICFWSLVVIGVILTIATAFVAYLFLSAVWEEGSNGYGIASAFGDVVMIVVFGVAIGPTLFAWLVYALLWLVYVLTTGDTQ